ncbi:hypothetical protein HK104_001182 [Borealophlyctis nickersoniae]|nr:hypothetical protein HK104_001182 [Borealophlyctis nickersoniae]
MAHAPSNPSLIPGVSRYSRSQAFAKKAYFKKKRPVAPAKAAPAATTVTKTVGGDKNGKTRTVSAIKTPRFYAADDVPVPKKTRKTHRPPALRATITPGTVLILLAGRFRGKRVVFLKQLPSGLLLVTGPYKVNGVPIRRVNQAYVIATSTKVDISGVTIDEKINDDFFKREKVEKKKATEEALFEEGQQKKTVSSDRVSAQKTIDAAIIKSIKKTPVLKAYLNASFSLSKGQYPHALKF